MTLVPKVIGSKPEITKINPIVIICLVIEFVYFDNLIKTVSINSPKPNPTNNPINIEMINNKDGPKLKKLGRTLTNKWVVM